jgi:hypothetical protein
MEMKKMMAAFAALMIVLALQSAPASAQANPFKSIPVTGVVDGGTFSGVLNITRFERSGDGIVAIGTLTGTINLAIGVVKNVGATPVTMPTTITGATCDILNLRIGAISLDLLGLNVDLSAIALDITAQQGSGELLGNLLCAVAHLFDGGGPLADIISNLNQILDLFG